MSSNAALRYYLPKTVLTVAAHVRYVVIVDSAGGHLEPRIDVRVRPRVVPDRSARCSTTLDAGVLESASLGVQLSPDGLIDAVGSHVHALPRTAAPAAGASVGGRTSSGPSRGSAENLAEQADLAHRAAWTRPGSLRAAFDRSHPRTSALIADLSARAEQFLAGMRMGDGPAEVETFGSALAVVERELAAADRLRREWIAAQGFDFREGHWEVDLDEAILLDEAPPARLPADHPVGTGVPAELARDFGVLLAVYDDDRPTPRRSAGDGLGYDRVDELLLRQARPVTVAVYRRPPAGVEPAAGEAGEAWLLDDTLTQYVEAVDRHSALDVLSPQGHLGNDRALHVSFYPSGSVRSFGVSSSAAPVSPAVLAGAEEQQTAAPGTAPTRADVAAAALEAARLQLALLQASDEFTRLAATHAHGGELATLEQDARFAALRPRRG